MQKEIAKIIAQFIILTHNSYRNIKINANVFTFQNRYFIINYDNHYNFHWKHSRLINHFLETYYFNYTDCLSNGLVTEVIADSQSEWERLRGAKDSFKNLNAIYAVIQGHWLQII